MKQSLYFFYEKELPVQLITKLYRTIFMFFLFKFLLFFDTHKVSNTNTRI